MSTTSPYMNLTLPTPTVTLGPEWASQIVTAFGLVDSHDHSSGFGVKVTPAGININADLNMAILNRLINTKSVQHADQLATLTGAANASSVYSVLGDLYYTNGSGVAIQLTSGGAVVSVPAAVNNLQFDFVNTDLTIGAGDAYVYISLDTSAGRTVTLPAASAVTTGRIYIIADQTGTSENFPVSLATSGGDTILGAASLELASNFGTWFVIGNGTNKWCLV